MSDQEMVSADEARAMLEAYSYVTAPPWTWEPDGDRFVIDAPDAPVTGLAVVNYGEDGEGEKDAAMICAAINDFGRLARTVLALREPEWRRGIPSREVVEALEQTLEGADEPVAAFLARDMGFTVTVFACAEADSGEVRFDVLAPMLEAPRDDGSTRLTPPRRVYPTDEWEFRPVDIWEGTPRQWPAWSTAASEAAS